MMFASAGILWGVVTVFKGLQLWRHEHKRMRGSASCAVGAFPLNRFEFPALIVAGAAVAIGCLGYLVFSFLPL